MCPACALALAALVALASLRAHAQATEVIDDPELAGVPVVAPAAAASNAASDAPTGEVRVVLRTRIGVDFRHESPREDVVEATQIGLVEAHVRRSERLRFAVGVRVRHLIAAREHATPDADADRWELDAAPTAAYGDATLADGLHLRLGYQSVRLGRFDLFSATDVLSVADLRSGPATMPEAADVAQPAARLDWDATRAVSFQAMYVPFFQPHTVALFDTDFALVRPTGVEVVQAIDDAATLDDALDRDDVAGILRGGLSRGGRGRLVGGTFAAFAPDPSPTEPQGALRAAAHGPAGELALTLASALERLPAVVPSAALLAVQDDDTQANRDALALDPRPQWVDYGRFYVAALDGAVPVGPVQLGAEVAYHADRVYLATEAGRVPVPEQTGVVQGGLRVEHAPGGEWLAGAEGFVSYALDEPARAGAEWMFVDASRWRWGAAALVAWSPSALGLTLELSGGLVNGTSSLVGPRVEQRLVDTLYAELGAYFVEGSGGATFGNPNATLGGLYDDADLVYVGLKWLP